MNYRTIGNGFKKLYNSSIDLLHRPRIQETLIVATILAILGGMVMGARKGERVRVDLLDKVRQKADVNNNGELEPPEIAEIYRKLERPFNGRDFTDEDLRNY